MKKYLFIILLLLLNTSSAQFELKKHSINSGGATMAGGNFTLKSSIGQVDASNTMSGTSFSLNGGFWHKSTPTNTTDLIFKNSFE